MSHQPRTSILVKPGDNLVGIVNALPNGSRVVLQPGTHTVTASMNLNGKSNITIEGGPDSIINDTRTANVVTFRVDTTSDVTLRGFKIVAATNGGWVIDDNAGGGTATRLKLLDLTIELTGTGSAAAVDGTNASWVDFLMQGCTVFGSWAYGIRFSGASAKTGCRIIGNRFIATNRPVSAIRFGTTGQSQSVIVGNHIEHVAIGIYLRGTEITCVGNTIYDVTGDGVAVDDAASRFITIVGNTITSGTDEGIEVIAGSYVVVSGNTVRSMTGAGISTNAPDCIVADNVISSVSEAGVYVDSAALRSIVIGNRINTTAQMGIYLGYAGGTISLCVVHSNVVSGVASTYEGIQCEGQTLDCILTRNVLNLGATGLYCVQIAATSARIIVAGNALLTPVAAALRLDGPTHILAVGNLCQDNGTVSMIDVIGCDHIVLADNYIRLAGDNGVYFGGTNSHCVVDGGEIESPVDDGVFFAGGSTNTHIDVRNVKIYTPGESGVDATSGTKTHLALTGIRVVENGSDGLDVRGNYTLVAYCKVFDTAGGNDGIEISADYGLIFGCIVRGGSNGLQFGNGGAVITDNHCLMANNLVHDCGSDGIYFEEATDCSCVGTRVVGCAGNDGIQEDAACDQNYFGGNHVRGNGTALNLNGTNRTVGTNKV